VATSLGAALAVAPLAALACFATYLVLFLAFRISSLGSLVGVGLFPVFLYVFGQREPATLAFAGALVALVVFRHKGNIRRLVRGEELRA
jgi:glycerol-3-phosphate acyltransferase PlsY